MVGVTVVLGIYRVEQKTEGTELEFFHSFLCCRWSFIAIFTLPQGNHKGIFSGSGRGLYRYFDYDHPPAWNYAILKNGSRDIMSDRSVLTSLICSSMWTVLHWHHVQGQDQDPHLWPCCPSVQLLYFCYKKLLFIPHTIIEYLDSSPIPPTRFKWPLN